MEPPVLNLILHMHQPLYIDPERKIFSLPFVRLHAIRGYYDIGRVIERYGSGRVTVNLVPSLVLQLKRYLEGYPDHFAELASKDADSLSFSESLFITRYFFQCPIDTMIAPYPRYLELFGKAARIREGIETRLTTQELRDLQVWFNLTWFGFSAREEFHIINELIRKGKGFTEKDKEAIFEVERTILSHIIPLYRNLIHQGRIELSVSPFYHPILPLIIDSNSARRCLNTPMPPPFHYAEDAETQVKRAIDFAEVEFGKRPSGVWPSEGSVSKEVIDMFSSQGVRWTATDARVLRNSKGFNPKWREWGHLSPYLVKGSKTFIFFRDTEASDMISFVFSKEPTEKAVSLLKERLLLLQGMAGKSGRRFPPAVVTVIIDGENPWPYYPDGGREFLMTLFGEMERGEIGSITPSSYLDLYSEADYPEIDEIWTGSWINADFSIWIGSEEDRRGWSILKTTRDTLERSREKLDEGSFMRAYENILAAEGSDWFWWFGDEFRSDVDSEFDRLFRSHLKRVFHEIGEEIPPALEEPVKKVKNRLEDNPPLGFIHPEIDGRITNYFEWKNAGFIELRPSISEMHIRGSLFSKLYYGFDRENLFLRLDPDDYKSLKDAEICLRIVTEKRMKSKELMKMALTLHLSSSSRKNLEPLFEKEGVPCRILCRAGFEKIIEVAIPLTDLGLEPGERFGLSIEIGRGNSTIERYPEYGVWELAVPDSYFDDKIWSV